MIYLDNAATSFPKPNIVCEEMNRCMLEYCANPGRGGHSLSIRAGKAVIDTRDKIAAFFNIKNPLQICFTKNATEAINIGIKGLVKSGGHVVTSAMEHNSVYRPLKTVERDLGVQLTVIKSNLKGDIDPRDFEKAIKTNTQLIVCTLSSNVNGTILPVNEIGAIARKHGIPFMLDASQGAGSIPVDVEAMYIDMLAAPGHKGLLGPQGTGFLYVGENIKLKPLLEGGTGTNSEQPYQPDFLPDMLESGTINTPGIVGLGKGIEYINSEGFDKIIEHKNQLTRMLINGIKDLKNSVVYSYEDMRKNSGIVAMNFKDIESNEVSYVLDRVYGICTRSGLHCSPLGHTAIDTLKTGVVRFSPGCFNTKEEIEKTLSALQEISVNIK